MAITQNASFSSASTTPATSFLTRQSQQPPSQPQLPQGHIFDILPALHELLARIEHTTLPDPVLESTEAQEAGPDKSGADSAGYPELQPLEPKELPTEVLGIKARIRRAQKELERLPDMERSVDEQQEEIVELQARIKAQREMLNKLGLLAGQAQLNLRG